VLEMKRNAAAEASRRRPVQAAGIPARAGPTTSRRTSLERVLAAVGAVVI
jgi:hypothetical protein